MFGLGMGEALIILAVVLLIFGGKKLPQLGKSMGEAINNFKKGLNEGAKDSDKEKIEDKENK
ncbi:twin arginine-targeting protein, translocase, TatA/E family [Bacteriovorax sp. BSW11_IV]|uniref:twin-arginine translocase TatA/TatE family subunit n=1 Tax=Bacteriovorax sp. BSW11_IV TaxID=1353529 RepID=UPI00038A3CB1|nr:twin-arginine translocase TatA/TatE family subunit [Bacteriovorax sp. BSW11_IV]EQC46456.1 twin arginine-targeting protein, translocase, TatA/E family [Bacteriovorax sp. BSW11_IV]